MFLHLTNEPRREKTCFFILQRRRSAFHGSNILGKKSNGPPAINFPNSRTAGRIFIIHTSF